MVEDCVSPAAVRRRKPLAVLFHDERLRGRRGDLDDERGFLALLVFPLQLDDFRAFRKRLAVAGDARLVSLDHHRIRKHDLELGVGTGRGNHLPALVPPKSEKAMSPGDFNVYLSNWPCA